MGSIKSMSMFFIDNQQMWPKGATLLKNLVIWPDAGKYPTYVPIALANHPEFNGKIAVMGGNRGVVVAFAKEASTPNDVQAALSDKTNPPEQYRIAIESIIHAIMLYREQTDGGGDAHPLALLTMLGKTAPLETEVLIQALRAWLKKPAAEGASAEELSTQIACAEDMCGSLEAAMNEEPDGAPS